MRQKVDPKFDQMIKQKERELKAAWRKMKKQREEQAKAIEGLRSPTQNSSKKTQNDKLSGQKIDLQRKVKSLQQRNRRLEQRILNAQSGSTPASIRKRDERARRVLPESPNKWAETVNHLVRNSPRKIAFKHINRRKKPRHTHKCTEKAMWANKIITFFSQDDISRQMPTTKMLSNSKVFLLPNGIC